MNTSDTVHIFFLKSIMYMYVNIFLFDLPLLCFCLQDYLNLKKVDGIFAGKILHVRQN